MLRFFFPVLAVCLWLATSPSSGLAEEVPIGGLFSLSGAGAGLGESSRTGAEIAVSLVNEQRLLGDKTLRLIVEDSASNSTKGVLAFRKLAEVNKVRAVVLNLTSVGLAVRDLADEYHLPSFVGSIFRDMTMNHQFMFRNFFSNGGSAAVLLETMRTRNLTRLAVLHAEEDIGQDALRELEERARQGTFSIVAHESFAKDSADIRTQLLRIKQANPQLVYVAGYGPAVALAYRQAKQLQLGMPLLGTAICGQADVLASASDVLEGTLSSQVLVDRDSETYQALVREHSKRRPGMPLDQNVLSGFDDVWVVAHALARSAEAGESLREAILDGAPVHGAAGVITFTKDGESDRPMELAVIRNGRCVDAVAEHDASKDMAQTTIGVILPLSGDIAGWGENIRRGIELGLDSAPGLTARYEDEGFCNPARSLSGAQSLIARAGVRIFITGCLNGTEVIAPVAQQRDLLLISAGLLRGDEDSNVAPHLLSIAGQIFAEGRALAELLKQRGVTRVAFIRHDDTFTAAQLTALRANGYTADALIDLPVLPDTFDMAPYLIQAKKRGVDGLLMYLGEQQMLSVARRRMELHMEVPLFSGYVVESNAFTPADRAALEGVVYTYPRLAADTDAKRREFEAAYRKRFGADQQPIANTYFVYDGVRILSQAVAACESVTRECVRSFFLTHGPFHGVSGAFSFDEDGFVERNFSVKRVFRGEFTAAE